MKKYGYARLLWGGFIIALGVVLLLDNLDILGGAGALVWAAVLAFFALSCLTIFIVDRQQWWALIPALTLAGISLTMFLEEINLSSDDLGGAIITGSIGLSFLFVFASNRQHWWALIPAMTMLGVGLGILWQELGLINDEAVGGIIVAGVALGFIAIFVFDRRHWWALFPGGIIGSVAFILLLATAFGLMCPLFLILLGLLMLWGNFRPRSPRKPRRVPKPARKRLPTLEEQVEQAIADESRDAPPAPELPPAAPERPPTLEDQIKAAIAEPNDTPPAPENPEETQNV